jgi:hypothetical protein
MAAVLDFGNMYTAFTDVTSKCSYFWPEKPKRAI